MNDNHDQTLRLATFDWLKRLVDVHGDVLSREFLARGFEFQGERVHVISAQGIFKPHQLELPLSITTVADGPYNDSFDENDLLRYRYRGTDPGHRDNLGLKRAMLDGLPLVYFHAVVRGQYLAVWPVYVVGADDSALTFTVAADNQFDLSSTMSTVAEDRAPIRQYVTATVRQRLHQRGFRERVLRAYRNQCSLCRLRHPELLDAAHIIEDPDPRGEPIVTNGLSLCKLHHAAFDRFVIGVSPDCLVHVRADVLEEIDGPMLQHGLKEMHGREIARPRSRDQWPDRERLAERFDRFVKA